MHSLPDLRWVPVPGSRQVRRGSARRASRAAVSERDAAAEFTGRQAGDERQRTIGEGSRRGARWRRGVVRRRHRRALLRGCQLREAVIDVGERQAPQWPRQRLRPGRPKLHVPQQHGRPGDFKGAEPDVLSEDHCAERFLFRHGRVRVSDGQHPDGRQVGGRDVQRREAARDQARAARTVE